MLTLNEQSVHTGNLILVNASHGIQGDPEDVLVPACSRFPEILLQRCAATLLNELMKEKTEKEAQLEEKMDRWMYLTDLVEQIESQK